MCAWTFPRSGHATFTLYTSVDGGRRECLTRGGTRSDWPTDPSQPEKLKISQLLTQPNGADGTDGPTMHFKSGEFSQGVPLTDVYSVNAALALAYVPTR